MNCFKTIVKVSPLLKISVQSLEIILDRQNAIYFGGEILNGHCKVSLIEPLHVNKIKIKFSGQAKTYIETNKNRNAIEYEKLFQHFFFYKDVFPLQYVEPGTHRIDFNFTIPINIPSTFEYTDSHIKYKVKASFGLITKSIKVTIFTNPNISISNLMLPIYDFKEKKIGFISSRVVSLQCELPRTGFTVGKNVPVTCIIENHSDKSMILKANLRQEILLFAMLEHKVFNVKVNTFTGPFIEPNCNNFQYILNVPIPEHLPIVFDTCKLVHINYILDVYLDIPVAVDLHCKMDIILTYQWLDLQTIDPLMNFNTIKSKMLKNI